MSTMYKKARIRGDKHQKAFTTVGLAKSLSKRIRKGKQHNIKKKYPYYDFDTDGKINKYDCQPLNKYKQDDIYDYDNTIISKEDKHGYHNWTPELQYHIADDTYEQRQIREDVKKLLPHQRKVKAIKERLQTDHKIAELRDLNDDLYNKGITRDATTHWTDIDKETANKIIHKYGKKFK